MDTRILVDEVGVHAASRPFPGDSRGCYGVPAPFERATLTCGCLATPGWPSSAAACWRPSPSATTRRLPTRRTRSRRARRSSATRPSRSRPDHDAAPHPACRRRPAHRRRPERGALQEPEGARRPVEYVRYPNAGHDLSRSGDPLQRIDRLLRIYEFMERFIDSAPQSRRPATTAGR